MKALLYKDLQVINKKLWFFAVLIPIMTAAGGTMTVLGFFYCILLSQNSIYYDEQSKWSQLAEVLPYKKKDIVLEKFVLSYIFLLCGTVLIFIGQTAFAFILNRGNFIALEPSTYIIGASFSLIYVAVNTPILLIYGFAKARLITVVLGVITAMGFYSLISLDSLSFLSTAAQSTFQTVLLPIIAIVANIITINLTIFVKSRK